MQDMMSQDHDKGLKNMDFLAWRVRRSKTSKQYDAVNRVLFSRPRLRRDAQD